MLRVDVDLDAPNALLGADALGPGALLRLERSANEDGVYAEIDTAPIVADTYRYTFWDPVGASTSWYRWRAGSADETSHTGYSEPFQGDNVADATLAGRYASVEDLLAGYQQDVTDTKLLAKFHDKLGAATQQITSLLGFDFFRHPAVGSEERLLQVDRRGRGRLCVHDGIASDSVTLVEVRGSTSSAWEELAAADWTLEPPEKPGHPSFHLRLTGAGSWSVFPRGDDLVRVTGAFGWPAVPADVRQATIDRARQLAAWDASRPGGAPGPEELGASVGPNRMPDTMFRLKYDYSAWELGLAQCEL